MKNQKANKVIETPKGEYILDSVTVAKSIIESKELQELNAEITQRRERMKVDNSIRDFVREVANDSDLSEIISVKSRERAFIRTVYEKTDIRKSEVMYLFAVHVNTFSTWYKEEGWAKKNNRKIMDKEKLINLLYSGEYDIIRVRKESTMQVKKKYNNYAYKIAELAISSIQGTLPDNNVINALKNVNQILKDCYNMQLDVRDVSNSAKDRELLSIKKQELSLKEREVQALEKASTIKIVSPNEQENKNTFSPYDVVKLFERFISERNIDEDIAKEMIDELANELGENESVEENEIVIED